MRRGISAAARFLLGAALVAAGAGKLSGSGGRIAPVLLGDAAGPLAFTADVLEDALPWLELLVGAATWARIGRACRSLGALGLSAAFVAAALAMPEGVRCGCFGALGALEGRAAHVGVAAGMLGMAAAVSVLDWRAQGADRKSLTGNAL